MPLGKAESRLLRYSAYGFLIKSPAEWKMEGLRIKAVRNAGIAYTTDGKYRT